MGRCSKLRFQESYARYFKELFQPDGGKVGQLTLLTVTGTRVCHISPNAFGLAIQVTYTDFMHMVFGRVCRSGTLVPSGQPLSHYRGVCSAGELEGLDMKESCPRYRGANASINNPNSHSQTKLEAFGACETTHKGLKATATDREILHNVQKASASIHPDLTSIRCLCTGKGGMNVLRKM